MSIETLKTDEAARALKMSEYRVRKLLKAGHIPGAKIGRQWRVDAQALATKLKGSSNTNNAQQRAKK